MNEAKLDLASELITGRDKDDNRYVVVNNTIKLFLRYENRPRNIGHLYLNADGQVVYSKVEEEEQRHRATDSWSVNNRVFGAVDIIVFRTDSNVYTITAEKAKEFGQYLYFKETTELKLYVPVQYWEKKYGPAKPRGVNPEYPSQTDLFNPLP